jgi:hypothetical protein
VEVGERESGMKFGKDFRNHLEETLPTWRDKHLTYKALKKLIKRLPPPADVLPPPPLPPLPAPPRGVGREVGLGPGKGTLPWGTGSPGSSTWSPTSSTTSTWRGRSGTSSAYRCAPLLIYLPTVQIRCH